MSENRIGHITQLIGAVVDVYFEGSMLAIYNALRLRLISQPSRWGFQKKRNAKAQTIVLEVVQHRGDGTVRCIAMSPTEGLKRGMKVVDTGNPISVPVGDGVLGRMMYRLGQGIDEKMP